MLSENEAADNAETTETTTTKTIAKVVEPVDLTTISVDAFLTYKLRTLVDNFPLSWGSKAGKVLEKQLGTKKGLYIWMKKSDIPAQVVPLEWFMDNLKETDPKKGSLIKAHYIGSGDVLARGWSCPASKHPFGDWLKGEDNLDSLVRTDFQYFYISIKDQAEYESLETALQGWNKVNREDKLPFEISETSGSGGKLGSSLRIAIRHIHRMEIPELAMATDAIHERLHTCWAKSDNRKIISGN